MMVMMMSRSLFKISITSKIEVSQRLRENMPRKIEQETRCWKGIPFLAVFEDPALQPSHSQPGQLKGRAAGSAWILQLGWQPPRDWFRPEQQVEVKWGTQKTGWSTLTLNFDPMTLGASILDKYWPSDLGAKIVPLCRATIPTCLALRSVPKASPKTPTTRPRCFRTEGGYSLGDIK